MADAKSKSYVTKVVSTMLGESAKLVDDSMADDLVAQFLEGKVVDGKRVDKLLFFAQGGTVICTSGDSEPLKGKGAFVVRVTDDGKPVSVPENDINFGTINGEDSTTTLQTLTKLMSEVYDPCLASNLFGYVKKMKPNEKEELEGLQKKCVVVIDKAISSLQGGLELAKPDPSDSSLQVRASAVGSVGRREGVHSSGGRAHSLPICRALLNTSARCLPDRKQACVDPSCRVESGRGGQVGGRRDGVVRTNGETLQRGRVAQRRWPQR